MPVLGKKSEEYQEAIARAMAARDAALNGRDGYAAALPSRGAVTPRERTCGAPDCRGGWIAPWKNRRRPIFEQEWGCGERCLTTLVQAAVQRETGDGVREAEPQPHRHRVPLGLVLLAQGWITHPQLQTALQAQRETGRGRIGDWLTQSCGLDQEHIARGLGVQWNCPVLSLEGFSPAKMALVSTVWCRSGWRAHPCCTWRSRSAWTRVRRWVWSRCADCEWRAVCCPARSSRPRAPRFWRLRLRRRRSSWFRIATR